jgi:hypothetical protein
MQEYFHYIKTLPQLQKLKGMITTQIKKIFILPNIVRRLLFYHLD